jgi:hypothetical protein
MYYMNRSLIQGTISGPGKLIRKLGGFLFTNESYSCNALVFFRVCVGGVLLIHFFAMYTDIPLLYGSKSIIPAEVSGLYIDELVINNHKLRQWTGLNALQFSYAFGICYVLFALSLVVGFFSRITALAMLVLHTSLHSTNVFFMYGADYFIRMSLFYLVIFPADDRYSMKALIWSKKKTKENYLIYLRFLQLHLSLMYCFSGIDKILGYNWRNGEAIWKAVNLPHANSDFNLNVAWLAAYPVIPLLLGWATMLVEITYPLIFIKKFRTIFLCAVIGMHVSIAVMLNLYFFSCVMIIWNLAAFYSFDKTGMHFTIRKRNNEISPQLLSR